ncbi:MAG: hypothetical protein JJT89_04910 [Nitriliruptoraceae bacterium]|nr:hypothetical protein [Nitriliruptoraceae bacterium]
MIVVAGEALIDLAPRGDRLLPLPGGSPYNVAVGLGRMGVGTHYLGALSTDGFGQRLVARLEAEGVGLTHAPRTDAPTTLAVVHLDAQGRASYGFYLDATSASDLRPTAVADLEAWAADADQERVALHVSFGAIGLADDPTGTTLAALLAAARTRGRTSLDPNVRPNVFAAGGGRADYARRMDELVTTVDLVKTSDEDLQLLHPDATWDATATRWAAAGAALVVVTRGPDGAVAIRPDGRRIEVAGDTVEVVDTVGAGDAFTTGLLTWLDDRGVDDDAALRALDDGDVRDALRFARRVAAITCTRAGSDPPRRDELD